MNVYQVKRYRVKSRLGYDDLYEIPGKAQKHKLKMKFLQMIISMTILSNLKSCTMMINLKSSY